jgi:ribosomal subunit interface protein
MQIPLHLSFHGLEHSDAIETRILERVSKLERLSERITSCRVAVETQSNQHHKGRNFEIRIDLVVPGNEIVATHADADIYVAIRDAFNAVTRQLEDHIHLRRGDVKSHGRAS